MGRVWFITGTSSGFGALLTRRLLSQQDLIAATARSALSIEQFSGADPERLLCLPCDVTRPEQVHAAVERTLERFGRIDVLVNNAGYGYFSTVEEADAAEIRAMFETNVFGLMRVTQMVLPSMRRRRAGVIVNLSSIAGRIATARGAFYQASKWAVEAFSEALHLETHPFGIRVIVIEPGSFETDFSGRSIRNTHSHEASEYRAFHTGWSRGRASLFPERQDPERVVEAILTAVDGKKPFDRIPVGADAIAAIRARDELGWERALADIRKRYAANDDASGG